MGKKDMKFGLSGAWRGLKGPEHTCEWELQVLFPSTTLIVAPKQNKIEKEIWVDGDRTAG